MVNENFLDQLKEIINFNILSSLNCVEEFTSYLSKKVNSKNKGIIPIMKKFYQNKKEWDYTNYLYQAVCLDFLIDENRYMPDKYKKNQNEKKVKSMIEELINIAQKNVSDCDVLEDPIGIAVIKRCLVEPGEYLSNKKEFYIKFTKETVFKSTWGKQIWGKIVLFKKGLAYFKKE